MKQCKAICKKTKKRCKHNATFGDYCNIHYVMNMKKVPYKANLNLLKNKNEN